MIGESRSARPGSIRSGLIVAAFLVVAVALRLWQLGELPFGFHPDEGHNALDAWRIAEGWRPVFLERNNGREPLYMYLMAGIMALVGPSIWSARLAGAVVGALLVAVQYRFVRSLPLERARRTAVVSAGLIAVTFWPIAQARYALRANLLPLLVTLMLWSWWRAARPRRPELLWGAATGIFLAGSVYTHLIGRLLVIPLVVSALWIGFREKRWAVLATLAVALGVAALLTAPLLGYFAEHPRMLSYRAGQVSILNPEVNEGDLVAALADNTWQLLRAPFVRGDPSWYHNLSGRPIYRPLAALAFLAGAVLLARDVSSRRGRRAQSAAVLVVVTLLVTIAPSWFSVGAPNYVRLTGAWPVLFLLPAWGMERAAALLDRLKGDRIPALPLGDALLGGALVLGAAWSISDYFGVYARVEEPLQAFNAAAVERGYQVARLSREGPLYVSPVIWNQAVIRFLNVGDPPACFDLRDGLVLPPEGSGRYALDPAETGLARQMTERLPLARYDLIDRRGQLSLVLLTLARHEWPAPARTLEPPAVFGRHIALRGAAPLWTSVEPGEAVTVTLEWLALAPTALDMNLFVHLQSHDGDTRGQWDGPPLGGRHPTNEWRPGERIVMSVRVPVGADAPPGPLAVRVGWYDWRTLERLPLRGLAETSLEVGVVDVAANIR